MTGERRVVTVVFTDLVDSTRKAVEVGDGAWRELLARHDHAVRHALAAFGGSEVKTTGDGFLATFEGPAEAIGCAAAVRDALRTLDLEARFGLHTGEVEFAGDDVGGIAVHLASRVMRFAEPGEILVSRTVRDLVAGSGVTFGPGRTDSPRGLPDEWLFFPVLSAPAPRSVRRRLRRLRPTAARWIAAAAAGALLVAATVWICGDDPRPPTRDVVLAVLPFDVRGLDPRIWREGLVDLFFRNLDNVAEIRAIHPRTVLRRWAERDSTAGPADLQESLAVARNAGASFALIGSAVTIGSRVSLSADVYQIAPSRRLEVGQVEGPADSIPSLVNRLSVQVLRSILADTRTEVPTPSIERITTSSVPALASFLEGEQFLRRSEFEPAAAAYRRAVAHDSTFAFAWGRLAEAYGWSGGLGAAASLEAAERAMRLSQRLTERDALILRGGVGFLRGDLGSVKLLQHASDEYPDDAEAWFLLGDALYHLGPQSARSEEEALPALRRALAIDPTFAPAYIHLIQIAFHRADRAAAADLMEKGIGTDRNNRFARESRLAYALAFEEGAGGARVRAALDTLELRSLGGVAGYLVHPRFLPQQATVLGVLRERAAGTDRAIATIGLYHNALARGRIREAMQLLDDPFLPPDLAVSAFYGLHALGIPLPPGQPDRVLASLPRESLGDVGAFVRGARAAELGREEERLAAVAELRGASTQALAGGDSSGSRFLGGAAEALDGYAAWKQGELQAARSRLEGARQTATGHGARSTVNATIRLWLAQLGVAAGRPREAATYFALRENGTLIGPFWQAPVLALHLAHVLETLGDETSARREYDFFLEAWRDADPQLEAVVAEARTAASRLLRPAVGPPDVAPPPAPRSAARTVPAGGSPTRVGAGPAD